MKIPDILNKKGVYFIIITTGLFIVVYLYYLKRLYERKPCPYSIIKPKIDLNSKETVDVQRFIPKTIKSDIEQKIPFNIIQTNEKLNVPVDMWAAMKTIIDLNREYDYHYFDNGGARKFIQSNFDNSILAAYDDLIPGAYKADLFRYCVLYILGGVYVDTGMVGIDGFKTIIRPTDTFISPEDNGTGGIYNAFMCCTPRHPILWKAIELCVENIKNKDLTYDPLAITGPRLLRLAFNVIMKCEPEANRTYNGKNSNDISGVKIIEHVRFEICESGEVRDGPSKVLLTKYPKYHEDRKWYNSGDHYSKLWREKRVYHSTTNPVEDTVIKKLERLYV